jgi:hypothetical protein
VGSFDLEISSVVADPAEFSVDPADATIAPGDSGVFTVTFSPETFGAHAGTLEIVHDGSSSPDTVTLAATVITSVSSSPASIAFGTVTGAGSLVDTVTLTNNDDDTISVASALSTDGSFSVSPGSAEIAPGERAQFLVTFAPVLAGGHTGQILFSHDGSPDGDTVDVSGTGVSALAVADLTPAEGNGGFANVPLTVTLTPPAPWGVTVILKTADGSAQAGADYTSDSTEIGFGPLDTTVVLNLQIFGDLISEADEDFVIQLSDVSGAVIIDTTALVTIQNDDAVIGTAAIISVADIPADQGGEVLVRWTRASNDSTGINPQTTSYGVWRKIPEGAAARASFRTVQSNDSLAGLYDFLGSVPATQTAVYAVPAPTLDDSTEAGSPVYTYIVTAHTSDSSLFTISAPDSGYSVDNLAPVAPAGLTAVKVPGPLVELAWDTPSETDIESHDIYRSDSDWFPLAPGLKIGAAGTNAFTDSFPLVGVAYYKIVARDIHGNVGPESEEVPVGLEASRTVEFRTGWSLVSVPLDVADFTADALFPDGITAAYAFAETGYVTAPELENGRGYWMKFPSAGDVSVDGNLIAVDTIAVHQGWNVIGSVSAPIAAASISSIPGGMITSVFYEYDGRYRVADTLRPGKGYWVKVASAGSLVLGSPENMQAAARIAIEPSRELPPPPPGPTSADGAGQADSGTAEAVPTAHALGQNYPNPFNPTTVIGYSLPEAGFVEIVVFDIAGQEVARPLSAHQEAGSRTVTFDASGLPSGVYTYQLRAGSFLESKKMLIMK